MKVNRFSLMSAAALLGTCALGAGQASATVLSWDPDGGVATQSATSITTLDWNVGNLLAVGGVTAFQDSQINHNIFTGGGLSIGGASAVPIQVYAQASLANFKNGNAILAGLGLNTDYEYTVVAAYREVITSTQVNGPAGTTDAAFAFLAGGENYLRIYYDPSKNANDLAGTGFNDGTLVLSASITGIDSTAGLKGTTTTKGNLDQSPDNTSGSDNYPTIDSISADGSTTVSTGSIFVNPSFITLPGDLVTSMTIFTSQLNLPFKSVDPSARFLIGGVPTLAGAGAPGNVTYGIGTSNGISGPAVQLQGDASETFELTTSGVPEPVSASLGMLSMGALALAASRRRRA